MIGLQIGKALDTVGDWVCRRSLASKAATMIAAKYAAYDAPGAALRKSFVGICADLREPFTPVRRTSRRKRPSL